MKSRPSDSRIREQIGLTIHRHTGDFLNTYPGMGYAEGVDAALRWVLGEEETPPMPQEEGE